MKKNIYSAFSFLGFMLLFLESGIKTIIKCKKEKNLNLWFNLLGKVFLWWFGILVLPLGVAMMLLERVREINYTMGNVYNNIIFIYIYIAGVVITRKLFNWKVNKL